MRPLIPALIATVIAIALPACRGRTIAAHPDEVAGVGIVLKRDAASGAMVVDKVFPSGPAAGSGMREGDRVKAIDGDPIEGQALATVVDRLRGPAGSDVSGAVDGGPSGRAMYVIKRQQLKKTGEGSYESR